MTDRAIIHIAGPRGAGKTSLVEQLLREFDGAVAVARGIRDDRLTVANEKAPKNHPELRRYRDAGADEVAVFTFPVDDIGSDAFFVSDLMNGHCEAVIIEGDRPVAFSDVEVFVAPPLKPGFDLLVRHKLDRADAEHARAEALKRMLLERPDGIAEVFGQLVGAPLAEALKKNPRLMEQSRKDLLEGLRRFRTKAKSPTVVHWAVAEGYVGIEHAQVVVINVRNAGDRDSAERLLVELERIRSDKHVFDDVLGPGGSKRPVTAMVADLSDAKDAGTKKAVNRIKRKMAPA